MLIKIGDLIINLDNVTFILQNQSGTLEIGFNESSTTISILDKRVGREVVDILALSYLQRQFTCRPENIVVRKVS